MKRSLILCLLPIAICFLQIPQPFIRNAGQLDALPERLEVSQDLHFRMLMENSRVRVWLLELRPGEKTGLVYRAHDFLQVGLQDASLSTSLDDRQALPYGIEKKARFVRGGFAQIVQNTDPETLVRRVEIEFMESIGVERCGPEAQVPCGCQGSGVGYVLIYACGVLESNRVRITLFEAEGLGMRHGLSTIPSLVVAISPTRVGGAVGSSDVGSVLNPGEVAWISESGRTLRGQDEHSSPKAVTVEFKNIAY